MVDERLLKDLEINRQHNEHLSLNFNNSKFVINKKLFFMYLILLR